MWETKVAEAAITVKLVWHLKVKMKQKHNRLQVDSLFSVLFMLNGDEDRRFSLLLSVNSA